MYPLATVKLHQLMPHGAKMNHPHQFLSSHKRRFISQIKYCFLFQLTKSGGNMSQDQQITEELPTYQDCTKPTLHRIETDKCKFCVHRDFSLMQCGWKQSGGMKEWGIVECELRKLSLLVIILRILEALKYSIRTYFKICM